MLTISKHVSWCMSGGTVILLDATAGRYVQLNNRLSQSFARIALADDQCVFDRDAIALLIERGYVRDADPADISTLIPLSVPMADSSAWTSDLLPTPRHAFTLPLLTILTCRLAMAIIPFGWALQLHRCFRRSSRYTQPLRDDEPRQLVRQFEQAQSFVRARGKCLPDAIALNLLARRSGYETWVMLGVRLDPFEAHSWVQTKQYILADQCERVCSFVPIARF